MSKPIEKGCKCIIVGCAESGEVVSAISYYGELHPIPNCLDEDVWEIDKSVSYGTALGSDFSVPYISSKYLKRIDDDKQELSTWEAVAKDCKWNPNEVTA